jgi:DNA polymerase-1
MPPIIYLIDGHALAYRTFYALTRGAPSRFTTRSGEPTAGVFGFTSVLLRILEQDKPDYIAVAFDTGKTFRDEKYPEYKATREKMPDELRTQIERIRELVDAFNIPRLEIEGFEADDVLGSVARKAVEEGLGVKIITGDRDLLQLVQDRIIVTLPGKSLADSKDYRTADVEKTLGVRPDQVVDYKALVGDTSDNIPGVAGIGPKTASKLLAEYENLDNVYAHLDELKPNIRKKLEASRENAYLSYELATIVVTLDIPLDLEQARPDAFDPERVEGLFRELEFRSLHDRLSELEKQYGLAGHQEQGQLSLFTEKSGVVRKTGVGAQISTSLAFETIVVDTTEKLDKLIQTLNQSELISFDTETTSTDQMEADLVGISLAVQPGAGYYIPLGHTGSQNPQLKREAVIEALTPPMTSSGIKKAGHNLKYDFVLLSRNGLRVSPLGFDTMIAEWLIDPTSRNLGLKNLAWVRQGIEMINIEQLIGKGRDQISMAEVPVEKAAPYAAADAAVVLSLLPELTVEMDERNAGSLFNKLEMPLVEVLADMEIAGVALDTAFLSQMSAELNGQIIEISEKIYSEVGEPFNLNSPQQLSTALFDTLEITPPDRTQKTASGFYSTSAGVLESLSGAHPVIDWVLEYRELSKLKSTYVDALPMQVNPRTGRVHTSFNQTGSVTGRLASSNPNLQNIPIRTELGRRVRNAFVASPGNQLVSVDYSQIELRIVAHIAGDQNMKAAFKAGQDIHAATAAAIYDVPLDSVTSAQRRRAKGVNFGLIYGMSAFGLTRYTDLTLAEAEDFMRAYFEQFPGVKSYLENTRRLAAEQGYVQTLLGRRRYFPGLKNQSNRNIRMREEREAINAPIQGSAADIMKMAMLETARALAANKNPARILLQVHDELVLECAKEEAIQTARLVSETMENVYRIDVPLETDARIGSHWAEMEALE